MALKVLMLRKQKEKLEVQMQELRLKKDELQKRESEIEKAIDEATTEEEVAVVEEEVAKHEGELKEVDENIQSLDEKLRQIDSEIQEQTQKSNNVEIGENKSNETTERKREEGMEKRVNFAGMTRDDVVKMVEREDVKEFLTRTRTELRAKKGVKGAELLIPTIVVDVIKQNISKYSKLINKVNLKKTSGRGRSIIVGEIPEAVWTEACAKINELDFTFNQVEVDGYKVAGFVPICNSTLEDADDVDLFNEIMEILSKAISIALDKAILYGTGKKMPLGIVTRLAQATKPDNYDEKAREWKNLSTTNILQVTGATAQEFFADMLIKSGVAKSEYSTSGKFWALSEETLNEIKAKAITFDASGFIVSQINNEMPVLGGEIITLPFVPKGDVIGGYGDLYLLSERAGMALTHSEHAMFIEDNTVFKGVARYDGAPMIAEGFIAFNVSGGTVTKTLQFAEDTASA